MAIVGTGIIGSIPAATAQTTSDCPVGFECIGDDPEICLPASSLEEHEANLRECQSKNNALEGRLEECRDSESTCKARAENLGTSKTRWKVRARARKTKLEQWFRKPLPWIGIVLGGVGVGYTIGSLFPPKALR